MCTHMMYPRIKPCAYASALFLFGLRTGTGGTGQQMDRCSGWGKVCRQVDNNYVGR